MRNRTSRVTRLTSSAGRRCSLRGVIGSRSSDMLLLLLTLMFSLCSKLAKENKREDPVNQSLIRDDTTMICQRSNPCVGHVYIVHCLVVDFNKHRCIDLLDKVFEREASLIRSSARLFFSSLRSSMGATEIISRNVFALHFSFYSGSRERRKNEQERERERERKRNKGRDGEEKPERFISIFRIFLNHSFVNDHE